MKTLYESILDDEETLIGNSIKDSQNPFMVLYNYYLSNGGKISYGKQKEITNILKSLELPLKSTLTAYEISINSPKSFYIKDDDNEALCDIIFDGSLIYDPKFKTWDKNDFKVYIKFDPMGNWGKKGLSYYKKLWEKKYNLSETVNPNIYIIK